MYVFLRKSGERAKGIVGIDETTQMRSVQRSRKAQLIIIE